MRKPTKRKMAVTFSTFACRQGKQRRVDHGNLVQSASAEQIREILDQNATVMNFYTFDDDGKIFKDVAATGIAGILKGIGAIK